MLTFIKALSIAAIGVTSISGIAKAATVDVTYKFATGYYLNCEEPCNDNDAFKGGDFELTVSYRNLRIRNEFADERFSEDFILTSYLDYGGETTANLTTPIGHISLAAIGGGGGFIDFFTGGGGFINTSESFKSVFSSDNEFFELSLITSFFEEEGNFDGNFPSISFLRDLQFDRAGDDNFAGFRLTNDNGDVLTSPSFIGIRLDGLEFQIAAVPLPATAPLLLAGLTFLGIRRRKA